MESIDLKTKLLAVVAGALVIALTSACRDSNENETTPASVVANDVSLSPYYTMKREPGGACDVDRFERNASSYNMVGWAAIDTAQAVVPEMVLAEVETGKDQHYIKAASYDRDDLADRFNSPKLGAGAGYNASIGSDLMRPGNKIEILLVFQNHLYSCGTRTITSSDI